MPLRRHKLPLAAVTGLLLVAAAGCGGSSTTAAPQQSTGSGTLTGLLRLTGGSCAGATPTGSYFRMIQPGGKPGTGPFVQNGDSTCSNKEYSLLLPGSTGGLRLDGFENFPTPAFDAKGNGLINSVVQPVTFFGIKFAVGCGSTDAQTKAQTTPPTLTADSSGKVTGTIACWQAAYNNAYYNQGAPKPDGSTPGFTSAKVSGTYDKASGKLTLDWSSLIVGGAFNNFGGTWHLEGILGK